MKVPGPKINNQEGLLCCKTTLLRTHLLKLWAATCFKDPVLWRIFFLSSEQVVIPLPNIAIQADLVS